MQEEKEERIVSTGIALRHTLRQHERTIFRIAWSPDGSLLASPSSDKTICLWRAKDEKLLKILSGHSGAVFDVAWSPDGRIIASGASDNVVRLWDVQTGSLIRTFGGPSRQVNFTSIAWSPDGRTIAAGASDNVVRLWDVQTGQLLQYDVTERNYYVDSVIWSPNGRTLATGSTDKTIHLWDVETMKPLQTFTGHTGTIDSIAWSLDGRILVSGSEDRTIRVWDARLGLQLSILEGHTNRITSISFSYDGRLLASKSIDGSVRIWRTDAWEMMITLEEHASNYIYTGLAFHPKKPILATLGEKDQVIHVWDLNFTALFERTPETPSVHYTNAKVVLVGDSGVGKSGLSLALTGQSFVPTESTHARKVWSFDSKEVTLKNGRNEIRETLLWDLAGQPGYRLIHQLHLNEVAVALIVFDALNETDPLSGVNHWVRALKIAERVQGNAFPQIKKLLVAARVDRGGKSVTHERIEVVVREQNFEGYFETSAKEGLNIAQLVEAIRNAIDWEILPKVTSTLLFQDIKTFLIAEKESGRILSTFDDLYRFFLKTRDETAEFKSLHAEFETCIGRVEAQGLIQRLSFGNLVLLQPELLDVYASAVINTVKDEPDGFGSILEEKARTGGFFIPADERIKDIEQEKLLLIAMVEDLLRYEIALREQSEDGPYLVFPSQSTRKNLDLPDPKGIEIVFKFEGPVVNIYTTLAVRLSRSGIFQKKNIWKDAVTYTTKAGGTYGIVLQSKEEGYGELGLFFDAKAYKETQFHFEEYVLNHLHRRALPSSIHRERIFRCPDCGVQLTHEQVIRRRERGFQSFKCGVCDATISLLDREERLSTTLPSLVGEMDRSADNQREHDAREAVRQGLRAISFDVFLCYNDTDKYEVRAIGRELQNEGIKPWFDEWELRPGFPWQRLLEKQIEQVSAAAVFVGKDGIGPWQREELEAFLRIFTERGCPVIPVLLPNAPEKPKLPPFLNNRTWVDFRKNDPDTLKRLIWGITGKRGSR